jgi:uncharacterized BrkB/YihY/UPF0761 family membrane protein
MIGLWVSTILTTFWIALGSFEAIFPDVLEKVFGVGYGFKGSWGVGRGEFELLTLGTLAIILLLALLGYAAGAQVRRDVAVAEIQDGETLAAPA